MILSSLMFKQIAYCHEASIERSKSITLNYAIDPSELAGKPPKAN